MSVLIHPTVRVSSLRELVHGNLEVLKYRLDRDSQPAPTQQVLCTCGECGWSGADPVYTDSRDMFNPPRGDIPRCRECGSFQLTFRLEAIRA